LKSTGVAKKGGVVRPGARSQGVQIIIEHSWQPLQGTVKKTRKASHKWGTDEGGANKKPRRSRDKGLKKYSEGRNGLAALKKARSGGSNQRKEGKTSQRGMKWNARQVGGGGVWGGGGAGGADRKGRLLKEG